VIASNGFSSISGVDGYRISLRLSLIEEGNNKRSTRSLWGVKKSGKDNESLYWHKVGFYNRTQDVNHKDTTLGYDDDSEFGVVAICYDPNSPRKNLELVWTKVCLGLLLCHKCPK
jgi:hypothetical protein